ncbi:MAG: zinc-binding dehydrogenase [Dehalococcoidia bacterium]|nr:zinc-binding dehydrogenase [Dehalococcoidia bacterium]
MKAVVYEDYGPPDVLQWRDWPDPIPRPGQILIRTKAVGVSFGEARSRMGLSSTAKKPGVLGLEVAGVVEGLGDGVTRFAVGDRVFGRALETYAELVVADADDCFPIPPTLTFEQAAVTPVSFQTAWHGLVTVGGLRAGQSVYVVPAGGGVASAAVQLARELGARVLAAAGGPAKVAQVQAIFRPDAVVDYRHEDVAAAARAFTQGRMIEIALDGNGEPSFEQTLTTLGVGGKLLVYGAPGGGRISTRVATIAYRRISVVGFAVTDDLYPITRRAFAEIVIPRLADGRLTIHIAARFPLRDAAAAHRALHDRQRVGKIVLVAE